ncbi:hypothetical protein A3A14_04215 [Candidatus Daviesbacteria bacterium RIFCSPLOWO2_01_FULL_43_38]|nr:MAG: hypothetical protein A3A14_04215 [Candidatus Daviesbacteria bacterium RIFCSPLOWO2_01_FULL_43_38]
MRTKVIIDQDELLIAKALLKKEFKRVYNWVVGDIRKCCRLKKDGTYKRGAGSLIGAFILWCCAVDYFGGLLIGIKKYRNWKGELKKEDYSSKQHVKAFVETYLKKYGEYDAEKVYRLRCSLVHNYTLSGYEVVEHDLSKRSNHLTKDSKNRYWLHLGSAIEDLEKAVEDYMNDVKKHDNFKINAYEYYTVHPLLKPMDLKDFASLSEPLVA